MTGKYCFHPQPWLLPNDPEYGAYLLSSCSVWFIFSSLSSLGQDQSDKGKMMVNLLSEHWGASGLRSKVSPSDCC